MMNARIAASVAMAGAAIYSTVVVGQPQDVAYPTRPVRVIVPFPPGSGVDLTTRIVMPKLAESMGQQFIVDNRGGAGGIVGTEIASKAPADGYHLFVGGGSSITVTPIMSKVSYNIGRDFAPISLVASVPFILVVHPAMPAKTLADLVKLARAKPGAINYASTGNWTTPHMTTELFRMEAKIDIVHVPYKGSAPALTDLLGGQIEMFFCNMLSAIPHLGSGKLRALAVTSAQRSPVSPQTPTVAESGYPGFESGTWFGVLAPAGVPKEILAKLHTELVRAVRRNDTREQLASQGAAAIGSRPDEFAAYIKTETVKWGRVLKATGARPD
jgi:tripartite-type tricarboxylate transporter receptor subunit TctC